MFVNIISDNTVGDIHAIITILTIALILLINLRLLSCKLFHSLLKLLHLSCHLVWSIFGIYGVAEHRLPLTGNFILAKPQMFHAYCIARVILDEVKEFLLHFVAVRLHDSRICHLCYNGNWVISYTASSFG